MADSSFADYCLELLSPLGTARAKRMFGGRGLYVDELFVAIVIAEQLYLKADALTRPQFEAAACSPFIYDAKGKPVAMSYFAAPEAAMESPLLMQPWARLAIEAALRAKAAKPATTVRKAAPASAKTAPTRKAGATRRAKSRAG
jgi:DNA transformation protein